MLARWSDPMLAADCIRAARESARAGDHTYGARVQSMVDRAMADCDRARDQALRKQADEDRQREDRRADREARAIANANAARARIAFWGV